MVQSTEKKVFIFLAGCTIAYLLSMHSLLRQYTDTLNRKDDIDMGIDVMLALDGNDNNSDIYNDNNNNNANDRNSKIGIDIDFDETVKEIKTLGSTQFTGKQKRKYEKEQYEELTGRTKKKQKVPLNIVRGIKKKAAIRERRLEQENKDAGIVTATTNKKKTKRGYSEQNRRDNRVHGPAPTIGFTKKGILSVRREKR
mmetsp:Transcript_14079/g.21390  ORF Transcript_14079/g.21390 Transcript_14079/m.21390 type:complete len:198 (+) Transcript_14079:150-743(+)